MVHNGIEYGLMAAYAEGFDVLKGKMSERLPEDERFDLNLTDIAEVWRRGSVVSSWLLDLSASALAKDQALDAFSGNVADSGEGQWTIDAAMEEAVPAYVLSAALFARYRSRVENTFGDKLLSAMRFGFGGHVEIPSNEESARCSPATIVIFGVTGDLTRRLLLPAIVNLQQSELLDPATKIIGVGRDDIDADILCKERLPGFFEEDGAAWKSLKPRIAYQRGDFGDEALYQALGSNWTPVPCSIWRWLPASSGLSWSNWARPGCLMRARASAAWWWKSPSAPIWPRPRR
jgi:hypothetical protein